MTLALDDALERRVKQLDERIGRIDKALAEDKASRDRQAKTLAGERAGYQERLQTIDKVLVQVRPLLPAGPAEPEPEG